MNFVINKWRKNKMSFIWQPKSESNFHERVSFSLRGGWVPVLQLAITLVAGSTLALAILLLGW
jgi:hypothetical protein